jgi:flagellin-like protein
MKNRKGISAIVATVLIILITVAAVTIIWAAIIPMIQDQIGGSTECFAAEAAISVQSDYTCYNATDLNDTWAEVQVHRGVGEYELLSLDIFTSKAGNSVAHNFSNTTALPDVNGDKVYRINITKQGIIDEVAVSATVRTGNAQKSCSKSGMVSINACN